MSIENPRWDPLTASSSALFGTVVDFSSALANTFIEPFKEYKLAKAAPHDGTRAYGTAGSASLTAGRGIGNMAGGLVEATLIDVPLALADGLHAVPMLYGEKPREQKVVTDWKSGGAVAGKVCVPTVSFAAPSLLKTVFAGIQIWVL